MSVILHTKLTPRWVFWSTLLSLGGFSPRHAATLTQTCLCVSSCRFWEWLAWTYPCQRPLQSSGFSDALKLIIYWTSNLFAFCTAAEKISCNYNSSTRFISQPSECLLFSLLLFLFQSQIQQVYKAWLQRKYIFNVCGLLILPFLLLTSTLKRTQMRKVCTFVTFCSFFLVKSIKLYFFININKMFLKKVNRFCGVYFVSMLIYVVFRHINWIKITKTWRNVWMLKMLCFSFKELYLIILLILQKLSG